MTPPPSSCVSNRCVILPTFTRSILIMSISAQYYVEHQLNLLSSSWTLKQNGGCAIVVSCSRRPAGGCLLRQRFADYITQASAHYQLVRDWLVGNWLVGIGYWKCLTIIAYLKLLRNPALVRASFPIAPTVCCLVCLYDGQVAAVSVSGWVFENPLSAASYTTGVLVWFL